MDIDIDTCSNYPEAKLHVLCQKYSLSATVARLGQTHFDHHTSYVIPGWSAISDRELPAGGMCVMITTFNLILNYSRAAKWFGGNVTLTLDHTYKVTSMRAHASLQTIEPQPQSRNWQHQLLRLATTTVTRRLLTSVRGCMATVNNLNPRSRPSPVFGPRPWTTLTPVPTNHIAPNPIASMKTLRAGSLSRSCNGHSSILRSACPRPTALLVLMCAACA
jgi:hypothetical protein